MRVLVTGRRGQLARSLAERAAGREGLELVFAARPELDLEDEDSIRRSVRQAKPDIVISAAAYTDVDGAEDEPRKAKRINACAAGIVATAAREAGAPIIHLSTDYVFDGRHEAPYDEQASPRPLGVYGRTKLAGEEAVRAAHPGHLILRTAWVYSPFGRNFVNAMLGAAREREALAVVNDQIGNPTSALDLADGLLAVVTSGDIEGDTLHIAGCGEASWAEFARHIFAESRRHGGPFAEVKPISSAEWPAKASRPANSRLDSSAFARRYGYRMPDWRRSSAAVVRRLLGQGGR
ncbi:MAG: dTDP-4-dehydrorhamnose reductase [Sphingomonadaceae bacterium]